MEKSKRLLTVIIPFLNEKEEVGNTIESVLEFSDNNVNLIIINDASNDNYDYDKLVLDYDIEYIKNEIRMGVAASRDLGASRCKTPYFLLLDAHMRFYDNQWVERITGVLSKNKNYLLCTQTKILRKTNGTVHVDRAEDQKTRQGAVVDLYNGNTLFESRWLFTEQNDSDRDRPVACILGAGYACSKEYWEYLKGLKGLIYYGNDEAYISMKVWLSGGECYLLKDVKIGHIYREQVPYATEHFSRVYNRLLINESMIFNKDLYKRNFSSLKTHPAFPKAFRLLHKNRKKILELKKYYETIFKHDFSFFEKINKHDMAQNEIVDKETLLYEIANHTLIRCYSLPDPGILKGQTGIIIFLFHYSKYSKSKSFSDLATRLFDNLCNSLNIDMSCSFESGLSGIGWGIQYLFLQKFITGDINEILEDFDDKIQGIDIDNMEDLSFNTGLGGIVQYINIRLSTITDLNLKNPFSIHFLNSLYLKLKSVVNNDALDSDSIDIFVYYLLFYEKEKKFDPPSLYDITCLYYPEDYSFEEYRLGLNGSANVGLKLILER
ncbi:MAG: glycosyltransferase [Prevotella sp.]|jgi:glycosyltransferase involved in cell wall biosynthesis|nr:glycosyltransferase [Prevotella sp.]